MKSKVKAAVGQVEIVSLDPKRNVARMKQCVEEVLDEKEVDLILFPELANTGYIIAGDLDFAREFRKCAEPVQGYTTDTMCELSKKYNVYIVVGIAESHPQIPGTLYNSSVLISPNGIVGVHHKVHIPGDEKHFFYAGNTVEVYRVDIGNIGMTICYDWAFGELTRILALKGMEIMCTGYQWPKPGGWTGGEGRLPYIPDRLRSIATYQALSNRIYVMTCNAVGGYLDYEFDGHNAIMSPIGETLAYAEEDGKEEVLFAEFSNDRFLEARSEVGEAVEFRDRRPELYGMLSQSWEDCEG